MSRSRAPRQKVRINRRPQDDFTERVTQAAAKQTVKDQRLNLRIAALVAILSVPSLLISLGGLYLQKQNEDESGTKEAARINWSLKTAPDNITVTGIAIENRSLNPASDVTLINRDGNGGEVHRYVFDYIPPCTRKTYTFPKGSTEVVEEFDRPGWVSLYFVDSLGKAWVNDGYVPEEANHDFAADDGKNVIEKFKIRYRSDELDACG
ncbi:hypothetical protein [Streptomyces sp. NPDC047981]|uniref:hypothetical protein n=1 Tax=Streptomyces sp. NPDC047981 TaxID=3154610 RepID=UPI0034370A61